MEIAETMQKIQELCPDLLTSGASKEEILRRFLREMQLKGNFYQEIEMSSRFVDSHQDISSPTDIIDIHSHAFYEVMYCREGDLQYLLGSTRYQLRRGDIIFVPPETSHSPLCMEELKHPYHRYVLWLSTEFMERALANNPDALPDCGKPFLLRTAGTRWEFLQQLFQRACVESEMRATGWELNLGCLALQILVMLQRAINDHFPAPAETPELPDRLLAYIQDHLSEKITLERTARDFLVSESTIRQVFQKRLGISFYRCVTQCRLIRAKSLIQQGFSMDQVSLMVGFSDYSAFYRAFKQNFGIPPTEYRRLISAHRHFPLPTAASHPSQLTMQKPDPESKHFLP